MPAWRSASSVNVGGNGVTVRSRFNSPAVFEKLFDVC